MWASVPDASDANESVPDASDANKSVPDASDASESADDIETPTDQKTEDAENFETYNYVDENAEETKDAEEWFRNNQSDEDTYDEDIDDIDWKLCANSHTIACSNF